MLAMAYEPVLAARLLVRALAMQLLYTKLCNYLYGEFKMQKRCPC